ncbi:MAG: glycosyltransferase family 4 protein [Gemmataceae bacterium]|nr:glycosyltransferase family 4 protein [Gemmata sp.]MDW8197468.1 glycosyltransferase family 4 protein [Gemmataceae bacterium]
MKIALITAGAAGMYCGSCLRDNTLVNALRQLGHDALLIPTYTPITTDEDDASQRRVFFGGVNVYLEQKFWFFRHTPWIIDRLFNFRWLLRWVSRFAVQTDYSQLGELTISMLAGQHGRQAKEVEKLVCYLRDEQPEVVLFTNALLSGAVPAVKAALGVPVLVTLQGDDIFLDALPERDRSRCLELIRANDRAVDAYISTSVYYADYMAQYLGIARSRIEVVPPGIQLAGHGAPRPVSTQEPFVIGYFARVCPEKGFHRLVEAFIRLRQQPGAPRASLKASGWLGANHRGYFEEQLKRLEAAGLRDDFEYVASPTHQAKVCFLRTLDVLCVPTTYREPKGLYVLEAWANGVPVVLPAHGAFPELVEATGGGLLVAPDSVEELADGLRRMLTDADLRGRAGQAGAAAVRQRFHAEIMARQTLAVVARFCPSLDPPSA